MSSNHTIPSDQLVQIETLRKELGDILPPDLDTDFNLSRWIVGLNGDIPLASKRLRQYIINRRAANLDSPDLPDRFLTHPLMQKFGRYLTLFIMDAINPVDNTIILYQRFDETMDFDGLARVATCGNILDLNFLIWEVSLRKILKREAETGKPSGLTFINDCEKFPFWNFLLTMNSPIMKINKLTMQLMQENYCDILHKTYMANSPYMAGAVWEVIKKFVDQRTRKKFEIIHDKEPLLKIISPDVLPKCIGGNLKVTDERLKLWNEANFNVNLETCGTIPGKISETEYFVPNEFPVPLKVEHLKPKQKFEVEVKVKGKKAVLWWQFRVNSEIQFGVTCVKQDDHRVLVVPKLTLNTPKLPEEGHVICEESCTYILEFTNCSTSWFSLKLEFVTHVENGICL